MSRRSRRTLISLLSALAVCVTGAALAFACTPAAYIYLGASSGAAGGPLTVEGRGFIPGPVDISWSGGGPLATATGPEFSITATVPASAKPGVYYVRAVARDPGGEVAGSAVRAFRIPAPAASQPEPRGAPERQEARVRPVAERRQPQIPTRPTPAPRAPASSPEATEAAPAPVAVAEAAPDPAPPPTRAQRPRKPAAKAPIAASRAPSERTATGDVWSSLGSGGDSSLVPGDAGGDVAEGPAGTTLGIGLGLAGAGLVALFGGLAVAGSRRRRSPAR